MITWKGATKRYLGYCFSIFFWYLFTYQMVYENWLCTFLNENMWTFSLTDLKKNESWPAWRRRNGKNENIFGISFSNYVDSDRWNEDSINSEPEEEEAPDTQAQASSSHSQALEPLSRETSASDSESRSLKSLELNVQGFQNTCSFRHNLLQSLNRPRTYVKKVSRLANNSDQ